MGNRPSLPVPCLPVAGVSVATHFTHFRGQKRGAACGGKNFAIGKTILSNLKSKLKPTIPSWKTTTTTRHRAAPDKPLFPYVGDYQASLLESLRIPRRFCTLASMC